MTATSIQYIGLTLTYASSFQMLRGAVIIFTGLLSRVALGRKLHWFKWIGIFFVIAGLATVGICDLIYKGNGGGGHNDTMLSTPEDEPYFHNEYFGNIMKGINPEYTEGDHNKSSSDVLLGDILIVCAQVILLRNNLIINVSNEYLI